MMDVLNWAAEHPFLTVFILMGLSGIAHGFGPKGTRTIVNPKEED